MLKYFSRKFSSSASSSFLPLKQTVLVSGIQPTGTPHLGNYLGALKNWVQKQENCHQAFFAIVDLHAITMPHNPKVLRENIIEGVIALLSCGLKSNQKTHQNVHIIQQSCIKEVCELAWIFSCICPNGRLDRMTQWKSKSHSIQATASLGLYAYPVLQAADVLLYKATHVPVGDDQKQHLELINQIVTTFNSTYNSCLFSPIQAQFPPKAARIMSLKSPTKKMSKSDPLPLSKIMLDDHPDQILLKIKSAVTDGLKGITFDPIQRPGLSNLMEIYAGLSGNSIEMIESQFSTSQKQDFKASLAELCIEKLSPIRENIIRLRNEKSFVEKIIHQGNQSAQQKASETILQVRQTCGLQAF
eukprot:Sdes_comp20718_c0_seq4m16444